MFAAWSAAHFCRSLARKVGATQRRRRCSLGHRNCVLNGCIPRSAHLLLLFFSLPSLSVLAPQSFGGHGRSMLASHLLLALPEVLHEWYPISGVNIPHKL